MSHHSTAIKNNHIGVIIHWGFKNSNQFMNYEKGIVEPIKDLSEVQIISHDEFDKLYKERNIKEGTKREQEYGKIHESSLKIMSAGTTDKTGKWSKDFAREIGMLYGVVEMFQKLVGIYNEKGFKELQKKPAYKSIAMESHFGSFNSFTSTFSDKTFDETITEEEILEVFGKFISLPDDWKSTIKTTSEESIYYFKIAKPVKIKIDKISKKAQEKTLLAEDTLLKNIKEKKMKLELHGHIPYGDIYHQLERQVEGRNICGDTADGRISNPLIGKREKTDSECYLCGAGMGYIIKDENTIEYFSFPKEKKHKKDIEIFFDTCELSDKKKQTHSFELTFPTGAVMFDNFFLDGEKEYLFDLPKEDKWSDKYTLQTLKGRFNRQDYISKTHNAGYAQMGNMSMDVFVSKDKKKIIIGCEPVDSRTSKQEIANKKFESEYKKVGHVSLRVWRWECADKQVLLDKGHDGEAEVTAKVIPGTYVVKHHYDNTGFKHTSGTYLIYSELTLKQK